MMDSAATVLPSSSRRWRVAIVTNVIPHYREDFYRRILTNGDFECHVFCQEQLPGSGINTVHGLFPGRVTLLRTLSARGERIAWQLVPLRRIRRDFDMCFVSGNPRVLSSVALSAVLRSMHVPVVVWGQAHSPEANPLFESLRLAWWRRHDYAFVYTDDDVAYLRQRGFSRQIVVGMNNGLDQARIEAAASRWTSERLTEWRRQRGVSGRTLVLSCARLVPKNRFELVLEALPKVLERYPSTTWCVIGDGPEAGRLRRRSAQLGVAGSVIWNGQVHDEEELAPWFLSSAVMVHPGAIGLSLLHAFGYGLPVITHNERERQMPEIAALHDGINGLLFRHGEADSLAETLVRLCRDGEVRQHLSRAALETAQNKYNTAVMAGRFAEMVRAVAEHEGLSANM